VVGDASTFVAGMSTVIAGWDAAGEGEVEGCDAGGGENGKGGLAENAGLNWLFCVFICSVKDLKACCMA